MREGQWPQQNAVNHAESGDVRADPQSKSQHRDSCEPRALRQHPQRVSNILEKILHVILLRSRYATDDRGCPPFSLNVRKIIHRAKRLADPRELRAERERSTQETPPRQA